MEAPDHGQHRSTAACAVSSAATAAVAAKTVERTTTGISPGEDPQQRTMHYDETDGRVEGREGSEEPYASFHPSPPTSPSSSFSSSSSSSSVSSSLTTTCSSSSSASSSSCSSRSSFFPPSRPAWPVAPASLHVGQREVSPGPFAATAAADAAAPASSSLCLADSPSASHSLVSVTEVCSLLPTLASSFSFSMLLSWTDTLLLFDRLRFLPPSLFPSLPPPASPQVSGACLETRPVVVASASTSTTQAAVPVLGARTHTRR